MKKILILIFLLWCGQSRAQLTQVPNTTTFSLQDVYDVVSYWGGNVGDIPTGDLSDCFRAADFYTTILGSLYDASYEGSHDRLSNFRNYGGTVTSCSQLPTIITVSMAEATSPNYQGEVQLTSQGAGCTVTEMGLVYGTSSNPTISGSHASTPNVDFGAYSWSFTGPTFGTSYYYRAFATNSYGTAYGEQGQITFECTRPAGYTWGLYYIVSGVPVTVDNVCSFTAPIYGQSYLGTSTDPMSNANGADIYLGLGTDCTPMPDGYYVNGVPTMRHYQVLNGKIYEICN